MFSLWLLLLVIWGARPGGRVRGGSSHRAGDTHLRQWGTAVVTHRPRGDHHSTLCFQGDRDVLVRARDTHFPPLPFLTGSVVVVSVACFLLAAFAAHPCAVDAVFVTALSARAQHAGHLPCAVLVDRGESPGLVGAFVVVRATGPRGSHPLIPSLSDKRPSLCGPSCQRRESSP